MAEKTADGYIRSGTEVVEAGIFARRTGASPTYPRLFGLHGETNHFDGFAHFLKGEPIRGELYDDLQKITVRRDSD